MLSEGQSGIQNTFLLQNSVLRLDIDKATYERCGLVGVVASHPGRKHVKSRFRVELDLRLQSMQRGKKGFERVRWAFQNVLNESMAWLFVDLESEDWTAGPISAFQPQIQELKPTISRMKDTTPPFVHNDEDTIHDPLYEEQLLEWLGLITLNSPRVIQSDSIDSYLCRYVPPEAFDPEDKFAPKPQSLVHLRWHGFASSIFVRHLWLILRTALREKGGAWISLGASTFEGTGFTTLCYDGKNVLVWERD
jgi:ribonuclease P/MRP protein subunit RPP40